MKKTNILFISILLIGVVFPINGQIEIVDTLTTDTLVRSIYGAETRVKDKDYIALTNELISSNNFSSSDLLDYATYSKYCANVKGQEMSVVYLNNLGICHLVLGNDMEASLKFDKAIEKQLKYDIDHDIEILEFNRAVANVRISKESQFGDYEDALSQFNTLPQEKFHSNGILYYQGLAEMYKENFSRASKKFIKDISINNSKRSKLSLCYAYYTQGKYELAYELMKTGNLSSNMESIMLFGLVASHVGKYDRAADLYSKLPNSNSKTTDFSEDPIDEDAVRTQHLTQEYVRSVLLAGVLAMSGSSHYDQAQALISDKSNLTKYGGCYTYGVVEFKSNKLREALHWFNKAKELNSTYPHAFAGIAMCKIAQNDFQEALKNLSQAIELSEDESSILLENRSLLHFINNCPHCGVQDIESILATNPDYEFHYQTLKNYAYYHLNKGNPDFAFKLFQQCKDRFPDKSGGYSGLGAIIGYNDVKQAEKYFRKAKNKEPELSSNYSNLANCLRSYLSSEYEPELSEQESTNLTKKIKSLYKEAISRDSTNFIALAGLASFQAEDKDFLLAIENGERAIEIAEEKVINGQENAVANLNKVRLLISTVLYNYSHSISKDDQELSTKYFNKACDLDSLAVSSDPDEYNYLTLTNRGWYFYRSGHIDDALSILEGVNFVNPSYMEIYNQNLQVLKSKKSGSDESLLYTYYYTTPFETSPPAFDGDFPSLLFQYQPEFEIIYKDFPISGESGGVCNMPD